MSGSPPRNSTARRLFVNNLAWATSDEELSTLFAKHLTFGKITECTVQRRDNNQSKGFAFVTFSCEQVAESAMYRYVLYKFHIYIRVFISQYILQTPFDAVFLFLFKSQ